MSDESFIRIRESAGREFTQAFLDALARPHRSRPIQVRTCRRGRWRRVVVFLRARRHDDYPGGIDCKFVRYQLAYLDVDTLAHFGGTGGNLHGSVGINVDKRVALIQEFGSEGDAKFYARHRQTSHVRWRGGVGRIHVLASLKVV